VATVLSSAEATLCPPGRRPRGFRPLLDERSALVEARTLLCHPVWRGQGVPAGDGLAVLLVPGAGGGEVSLTFLSRWLGRMGYRSYRSKVRRTIDCPHEAVDRLERRVELLAERARRPVAIVGQGLGGQLARIVAVRRPRLVAGIVSLGSPHLCASGQPEPFPKDVPFTSIYSRTDGVVDWLSCLDPAAEPVEVQSSHVGMAVHPAVFRVVGERLATMARLAPTDAQPGEGKRVRTPAEPRCAPVG
jgi:pimeloyl-ACP methyl ester carboxylesterase